MPEGAEPKANKELEFPEPGTEGVLEAAEVNGKVEADEAPVDPKVGGALVDPNIEEADEALVDPKIEGPVEADKLLLVPKIGGPIEAVVMLVAPKTVLLEEDVEPDDPNI